MSALLITLLRLFIGFGLVWTAEIQPQVNANQAVITNPSENEVLKGEITITGNTDVPGFESYELLFLYENGSNDGDTFLISTSTVPVRDGVLGTWRTNLITDSDYRLLLVVNLVDDKPQIRAVSNLRVRNYTPVEEEPNPLENIMPVEYELDDPAALEEEPTEQNQPVSLIGSMLRGMLYTVLAIVVLGLVVFGYTQSRRRR